MEALGLFKENALLMGITSGSTESVYRTTSAGKYAEIVKKAQEEEKQRRDQTVWLDLLEQMRARLDELDKNIADRLERLKAKYGDDPIQGMGNTYLTPDEMKGLDTPDDIMAALAKKYLDENGNLKPEFKGVLGPDELAVIQEWQERQELKPIVQASDEATAKNNGVTPDENGKALEESAKKYGIAGSKDMIKASENDAVADKIVHANTKDATTHHAGGVSLNDIG